VIAAPAIFCAVDRLIVGSQQDGGGGMYGGIFLGETTLLEVCCFVCGRGSSQRQETLPSGHRLWETRFHRIGPFGYGTIGIEVSPDGQTPYVNETVQRKVWAFTAYVTEVEHRRAVQFRVDRPGLAWQRWQRQR